MFFKRVPKPPLEYALDFVELAGETARRYIHDKDYLPTNQVMEQLRALEQAIWLQHCSLTYIIRTLTTRLEEAHTQGMNE